MVDGTVMSFLSHGHCMDKHPVQQEVAVEPNGYLVLSFCKIDICIQLPLHLQNNIFFSSASLLAAVVLAVCLSHFKLSSVCSLK